MNTVHHLIYLPGLGDKKYRTIQAVPLWFWKVYGVQTHYHDIGWDDKMAYAGKLDKMLQEVDKYAKRGDKVSIIGASAGASAAINVFAMRKQSIHKVVCVCGKLNNPQIVSPDIYRENPAFRESMYLLEQSLNSLHKDDLLRVLSLRPLLDNVVSPQDTVIPGAHKGVLFSFSHGISIIYALTFGSRRIAKFVKGKKVE